jgi:putative sigma-54 modulation protein
MDIEYTGRQTTVTKKLKTQAEAGLARIAKLVSRTASAHVILSTDKYRQLAEVTLTTRGFSLVANCEATEMEAALHDALAKLEKQAIRHSKKKATEKRHPKAAQAGLRTAAAVIEPEEPISSLMDGILGRALDVHASNGANGNGASNGLNGSSRKVAAGIKNGTRSSGTARKAIAMVVHSFPSKASRAPIVEPHVVRSIDSSAIGPMSLEVAVKEAACRDRDVFVFRDTLGQAMVLHRQRDGRMELIQIP